MKNLYPNTGPVRGLLYWLKTSESRRSKPRITYSRCLVTVHWLFCRKGQDFSRALYIRRGWIQATGIQEHGTCCWCRQPCEGKTGGRSVWHTGCVKAMMVAKGKVYDVYEKPVIRPGPCVKCGMDTGFEIDHRVALSVAWEHRRIGLRGWWKAWTVRNLQWLCTVCHATKTGHDRKLLARLRIESDAPMFADVAIR